MKSSYKKKSLNEFTKRVDNLIESIKVIHRLDRLSEREEWYFRHYIFLKNLNSASTELGDAQYSESYRGIAKLKNNEFSCQFLINTLSRSWVLLCNVESASLFLVIYSVNTFPALSFSFICPAICPCIEQ